MPDRITDDMSTCSNSSNFEKKNTNCDKIYFLVSLTHMFPGIDKTSAVGLSPMAGHSINTLLLLLLVSSQGLAAGSSKGNFVISVSIMTLIL